MGPRLARNQAIRKVVEETVRPPRPLRVAVLGGGITGLATAYRLAARKDTQVTLYEKSQQLGGWLQTEKVKVGGGNILFEWGPRTLRAIDALPTIELLHDLGLQNQILRTSILSPAAVNRFILHEDSILRIPLPVPVRGMFMKSLAPLAEPPFDDLLPALLNVSFTEILNPKTEDESVGEFVSRATSKELADHLVSAIFHGIYAGDIYKLSRDAIMPNFAKGFREYGSPLVYLFKNLIKHSLGFKEMDRLYDGATYESLLARERPDDVQAFRDARHGSSVITLQEGMNAISEALGERLSAAPNVDIKYNARISRISRVADDGSLNLSVADAAPENYDYAVSTVPCAELANMVTSPAAAHFLRNSAETVNVMVVNLFYHNPSLIPLRGFGYLIPRTVPFDQNPERALGVIFGSEVGIGQDEVSGTKLTVMLGGHWWDGWTEEDFPDEKSAITMAKRLLFRHLSVKVPPAVAKARLQRNSIPQYTVGHPSRMIGLHKALKQNFGARLKVAGASYTGPGINDCIRSARLVAHTVAQENNDSTGLDKYITPVVSTRDLDSKIEIARSER